MLAIVYFIIAAIFGITLVNLTVVDVRRLFVACAPSKKAIASIPNTLFTVPFGILVGILTTSFFNYFCILGLSHFLDDASLCRRIGMLVTFAIMLWLILSILVIINKRRIKRNEEIDQAEIPPYKYSFKDTMFFGIIIALVTAVVTFLMIYTYRISGSELQAGYSTFSDLAPHTAMVSSFSQGFNFPTQYMHFSGDGIQYHFLFYFFCGMLNYGGLPIDMAINLPSIVSMVCALVLLGLFAMLISGKKGAFVLTPLLVFFRSSWNVFDHLLLLMKEKTFVSAIKSILTFDSWYEVTPYDSWGIWAINVYPNQRHLMFGVGLIVAVMILFLPFLRRMCISMLRAGSFGGAIKAFLFSRNSWVPRKDDSLSPWLITLISCLTVILMPYFHGSALITMLLILFVMAIFSEYRLLHLIVAICAVASSFIQTMVFSGNASNVVKFKFAPGFILEDLSVLSVTKYILIVTGLTLVLAIIVSLIFLFHDIAHKKPIYRTLLFIACLMPMGFAFTFQITMEMLANHKFIQITLLLADAFVAVLLANMFALPFKRSSKPDEEEQPAVLPSSVRLATANGELFGDEPVNLADSDSSGSSESDELLDLPEEIMPLEEVADPEDEEVDEDEPSEYIPAMLMPAVVKPVEEAESSAEETPEEGIPADEAPAEEIPSEDIPSEETAGVRPGSEVIDAERKTDETLSLNLFEDDDDEEGASEIAEAGEESTEEVIEEMSFDEFFEEADDDREAEILEEIGAPEEEPVEESVEESVEELTEVEEPEEAEAAESEKSEETETEKPEETPAAAAVEKPKKEMSKGTFVFLQICSIVLALLLLIPLTATGLSEWCTYYNLNRGKYTIEADSSMTRWIKENTDPSDVFLTPMWSLNEFYLAGRPSYYGWPYYAWSAGHDTETRDQIYAWLISGCGGDINEFTRYCKERGIRYLIASPDFDAGTYAFGAQFNWEFFADNLTQVASFSENGTKIYKIY